jgi:hypothetical protein
MNKFINFFTLVALVFSFSFLQAKFLDEEELKFVNTQIVKENSNFNIKSIQVEEDKVSKFIAETIDSNGQFSTVDYVFSDTDMSINLKSEGLVEKDEIDIMKREMVVYLQVLNSIYSNKYDSTANLDKFENGMTLNFSCYRKGASDENVSVKFFSIKYSILDDGNHIRSSSFLIDESSTIHDLRNLSSSLLAKIYKGEKIEKVNVFGKDSSLEECLFDDIIDYFEDKVFDTYEGNNEKDLKIELKNKKFQNNFISK